VAVPEACWNVTYNGALSDLSCLCFCCPTCAVTSAHAEKRVALVIGDDRYTNLSSTEQLQKAVNDARSVGIALKRMP
jgi:hypothetical protein